MTGDEPQGTMGRVQTPVVSFPPSFARTFSSKERRLGTRQTPASKVCEAAPRTFFLEPPNELPEVGFGFPFNLLDQSNKCFFNRPIMNPFFKLVTQLGSQEQGFPRCLADRLNQ